MSKSRRVFWNWNACDRLVLNLLIIITGKIGCICWWWVCWQTECFVLSCALCNQAYDTSWVSNMWTSGQSTYPAHSYILWDQSLYDADAVAFCSFISSIFSSCAPSVLWCPAPRCYGVALVWRHVLVFYPRNRALRQVEGRSNLTCRLKMLRRHEGVPEWLTHAVLCAPCTTEGLREVLQFTYELLGVG